MQKFERPLLKEIDELVARLSRKPIDEIVAILGLPAKELGPLKVQRDCDQCGPWTADFVRRVEISEVGVTIRRLIISQFPDGTLEFSFLGREIPPDATVAQPTD